MDKFKGKYRIESNRAQGWNYAGDGWYFVTVCVKDKSCVLGEIVDGVMRLNEVGRVVGEEWIRMGKLRKNVMLDSWVIMPNHFHGIVVVNAPDLVETRVTRVSTTTEGEVSEFKLLKGSLGSIINQFKGACTRRIRESGFDDFAWQPNYYEHIIRNEKDLYRIRKYIAHNPEKWEFDKNFSDDFAP